VAIATTGWALGGLKAISSSLAKTVAFGAVSGGAMGAAQAAMAGGSWSDIFRAGVQGVVTGAIAAAIGGAVLHGWGDKALTAWADKAYGAAVGYHTLQSAGHAVVGGGLSELTGGNFKDGFIGAGFAALLSPVGRGINRRLELGAPGTGSSWQYLGRTATAATIGGTVTAISGGKFGNGAATAAFMHVVNAEAVGKAKEWVDKRVAHMNPDEASSFYSELLDERQKYFSDNLDKLMKDGKVVGFDNKNGVAIWDDASNQYIWKRIFFDDGQGTYLGECVSICKQFTNIPGPMTSWKQGRLVWGNEASISPGTVLGAFPNGKNFSGHAAIYTGRYGADNRGSWVEVADQYIPKKGGRFPQIRKLYQTGNASNGGASFSTVLK
jgi:hypothetical protein